MQNGVAPKAGWNTTNLVTMGTLARVVVQSAGGADSTLTLSFLDLRRAEDLREHLMDLAGRSDEVVFWALVHAHYRGGDLCSSTEEELNYFAPWIIRDPSENK